MKAITTDKVSPIASIDAKRCFIAGIRGELWQ